ncbi:unnamed protein product [Leptidea sinapis]|uniref:Uncharacterized protein n=1 Tax=Leptidea sinapis TaxID=189913 RepID=A0A5E4R9Z8_9NEOP|nr:unnamed protein product [Leptidea sinapis]
MIPPTPLLPLRHSPLHVTTAGRRSLLVRTTHTAHWFPVDFPSPVKHHQFLVLHLLEDLTDLKIGKSMLLVGGQLQEECNVMISTTKIVLVCQKLFCQMLEQMMISIFLSLLFLNKIIISLNLG